MNKHYQIGNYLKTYQSFKLSVPERYNWAYEVFDKWGDNPSKIAMVWVADNGQEKKITFKHLGERSRRLANALIGLGVQPGDRVLVMLPRIVEWWEIMLGCMRSLAVSVPGTTLLTSKDIAYRINVSGAKIAITDSENVDKLKEIQKECPTLKQIVVVGNAIGIPSYENILHSASSILPNPQNLSNAPLMIYFTSGTTGYPKMVLNTHTSYPLAHIITGKYWLDNRPSDLHWSLADTGWAQAAWTCFFAPWSMGAAIFIWDQRGKFDPTETLRMLEKYPITTFFAPPTAYRMLLPKENLSGFQPMALRHCVGAGEAVNPDLLDVWKEHTGNQIWEGYGQTETVLCIATFPGMLQKPGSMGVSAPGFHMAIVDKNGTELPSGDEGEIAIRISPNRPVGLFEGYWRNDEANSKAFRGDWYYTGDRATQDDDGYFWFVGRADDLIISSSYRIGPFEVESALSEHDSVAEVAVVASPDKLRGEIVKAFVVLSKGYKPTNNLVVKLQDYVRQTTAPYKYPRKIEFVESLPKTISGKIKRNDLRAMEMQQPN